MTPKAAARLGGIDFSTRSLFEVAHEPFSVARCPVETFQLRIETYRGLIIGAVSPVEVSLADYACAESPLDGRADRVCAIRYGVNALVVLTADRIQDFSAPKAEAGIVFQNVAFARRLERVTHRRGFRHFS